MAVALSPGSAVAGISGTAHDLRAGGGGSWDITGENQMCRPCHVPHTARQTTLLWSRSVSTGSYTPYSGFDMEVTPGQPDGASLLCLSCHDGTIAIGDYVNSPDTSVGVLTGVAKLGTNLSTSHPVSFDYTVSAAGDSDIAAATTTFAGGQIQDFLEGGTKLQCSTCHDPHNDVGANPKFLRVTLAASALCTSCHLNKG